MGPDRLRKRPRMLRRRFFARESVPTAVGSALCRRVRERCHAKTPPHAAEAFFRPRERRDRRGQRPLPPGPRTLLRKNAPASLRGRFSVRESVSTAALSAFCPPTRRMSLRKNAPSAAEALFFSRERIERRRQRPLPFCPENVVTQNAPASLRRRFSVRESVSTAALSALCRPTRRTSPRKNAPRAAGTFFCPRERRDCRRQRPCPPARRMSL